MSESTSLQVNYSSTSWFEVEFDLNKVHDWYVKWDTLYVKQTSGSEWEEFDPISPASDDYESVKHPVETFIEYV